MTTSIAYQPQHFQVGLYQADQFITPYNWTNAQDENITPVLRAQFQAPDGKAFEGFAKPFSLKSVPDAIATLNEVTGWILAKNYRLPCAERAFFIPIELNEMPPFTHGQLPPAESNGHLMCFVTEAISSTAVRGIFNTEALVREQAEWIHADHTIAFDEAIANPDRHPFNLLRKGINDFYLIDHGLLGHDKDHQAVHMLPESSNFADLDFGNLLHRHSYQFLNRNSPKVTSEGCKNGVQFTSIMQEGFKRSAFELAFWSSRLLPGQSAKWLNFLYSRSRTHSMSELLHKRYGVLAI